MSKKGTYQYNYKSLLLKGEIVDQFRKFCKQQRQKQSTVLEAMLHFFQWHGISPFDRFGPQLQREEAKTRKRIDAVIAIIKDIEKSQIKPTTAMLQALFSGLDPMQQNTASKTPQKPPPRKTSENTVDRKKYDRLQEENNQYQNSIRQMLQKVVTVKPTFGTPYFKLEIAPEELIKIERTLKK
jgi:hypothetical protein